MPMVRDVVIKKKRKVVKAYADGAYDSRRNFNLLDEYGIEEPAIRLKKGASTLSHGSRLRRQEMLLLNRVGYEGWKKLKEYGKRWMAEIVFSAFKGIFGDTPMARRFLSQKAEVALKVMLYNKFMSF